MGALSVIAAAQKGNFLHAPDTYMDKVACGPKGKGAISIDASPTENIQRVADCLKKSVRDMTVVVLDRPRHSEIINEIRSLGAKIRLIGDGDVSAGIATCWEDTGIDLLIGTGGAPEGVITAAALKCLGGDFQGKLNFRNEDEKARATKMGVKDLAKSFTMEELAAGPVMFSATGVTDGPLVKGVRTLSGGIATTHSVVMRSETGTIRFIEGRHDLNLKTHVKA